RRCRRPCAGCGGTTRAELPAHLLRRGQRRRPRSPPSCQGAMTTAMAVGFRPVIVTPSTSLRVPPLPRGKRQGAPPLALGGADNASEVRTYRLLPFRASATAADPVSSVSCATRAPETSMVYE